MPKKIANYDVGDLVFAKVKGFPAWPARVREKKGKKLDVIFFGTNETAVVKPEECSNYVENRKSFTQKYLKKRNYINALQEIEDAYNESVNQGGIKILESDNIHTDENAEDSLVSEPNTSQDILLDTTKKMSMEIDDEDSAETIEFEKRTPSPITQDPPAPQRSLTPLPGKSGIVSSRGRKIKPKRFMDDVNEEAATPPVAKRVKTMRSSEVMNPEPSTAAEAGTAAESEVEHSEEEGLAIQYLNSILVLNREGGISLAVFTVRDMKRRLAKLEEILSVVKKEELRKAESTIPFRHKNSVLLVSHRTCVFGLYMDSSRPAQFRTIEEQLKYEVRTGNEIMALYCEIESNEKKIDELPSGIVCVMTTFEQHLCLTREMLDLTDVQSADYMTEKKISTLRIEAYIMKLVYDVREAVSVDLVRLDLSKSVTIMRQLNKYELTRITLMKHPILVRTVMKLANYKGLSENIKPRSAQDERRSEIIRAEAQKMKTKFANLLNVQKMVWVDFLEVVRDFRNSISSAGSLEFLEIVTEEDYENMVRAEKQKQAKRVTEVEDSSTTADQKKKEEHMEMNIASSPDSGTAIQSPVTDIKEQKKIKKPALQLKKSVKEQKAVESKNLLNQLKFGDPKIEVNKEINTLVIQEPPKRISKDDNAIKEKSIDKPVNKQLKDTEDSIVVNKIVIEKSIHFEDGSGDQKELKVVNNPELKITKMLKPEVSKTYSKAEERKSVGIKVVPESKLIKKSVLDEKIMLEKNKAMMSLKSTGGAPSLKPVITTVFKSVKSPSGGIIIQPVHKTVLIPKSLISKAQSKLVLKDGSSPRIQISKGQVAAGKAQFSKLPSSLKLQLMKDGSSKFQVAKADLQSEIIEIASSPPSSPSSPSSLKLQLMKDGSSKLPVAKADIIEIPSSPSPSKST